MNDSKIGTWLMRDGRTAVVLVDNEGLTRPLQGMAQNGGYWTTFNWHQDGSWIGCGRTNPSDLIRKVSDSTELKPWKPEKRWRPWTTKQIESLFTGNMCVRHKEQGYLAKIISIDLSPDNRSTLVGIGMRGWFTLAEMFDKFTQHDGTPCGVEVEE